MFPPFTVHCRGDSKHLEDFSVAKERVFRDTKL